MRKTLQKARFVVVMVGGMTIGVLSVDLKMMGVIDMRKRTCATN